MPASIYSVTLPFTYHQTETIQQPVLKEVVLNLTLCLPSAHPCSISILNPQPLSLWPELSWLLWAAHGKSSKKQGLTTDLHFRT